MIVKISFTVDIKDNGGADNDLLGQIDDVIVGVLLEALTDNLRVEGYDFNGDTIESSVLNFNKVEELT
jgi:hypothetical protein